MKTSIVIAIALVCAFLGGYFSRRVAIKYPEPFKLPVEVEVEVTAYCPCEKCCGKWADGHTASGHKIRFGDKFIAAPKQVPFGAMIDIPGYGVAPVLDRGAAITGDRLDVYFDSHQEALAWGRQPLIAKFMTPSGGPRE